MGINNYIKENFAVSEEIFIKALESSPSSRGYTIGAISEVLLKSYLISKGYKVLRVKEKPSGGFNAKSIRGDFYICKDDDDENSWLLVECKGLKSNSEFRGSRLDSKSKLFRFLKNRVFRPDNWKNKFFNKGRSTYQSVKENWENKNPVKSFPPFRWNEDYPGPESFNLDGLWKDEEELMEWVNNLDEDNFKEEAYRNLDGPIAILETHAPSQRVGPITGIKQAGPLADEFDIMAVDLFLRTRKHEFVFMNSKDISHSPTSPEHLYQNYIIDILVKDKKRRVSISLPWYKDINECISNSPEIQYKKVDYSQVNNRIEQ